MALGPIVVRSTLPETRAQVWQMLTSDESRTNWWPETQIVAEMGGRIVESAKSKTVSEEGTDSNEILREGTVDVHVPEQTLGFRWKNLAADNDSNVVILLRPDDENMDHTVITVIESGFAGHPDAAELVETANNRWTGLLNTLEAVVTGEEITSEDSSAQETAEENDAEETTEEENLVQDSTVLEDTAAEDVVAESTGEEGTVAEGTVAENTGEEGTVAENAVAENATEDSS
ncbi:MAG TPA: SRPBCC domain-containing protein, partial [Microbacteriaceae bacterium]|nr:SRPBCC domain-containing protein [Microbacteriaceae bacterium]